jgi:hypothetical protein
MARRRRTSRLHDDFFKAARTLGDVQSSTKGPARHATRRARKVAYRHTDGILRRMLRALGL